MASGSRKSPKTDANPPTTVRLELRATSCSCAGGRSWPRRRVRPRLEQRTAGMLVRWPRRPAAVSEAVAAGAGPDFSCPGELEQPLKALIGEVRSLSVVCVCVSGLVGKVCGRAVDLPPWSVSSRVVCASWALGFVGSRKRIFVCLVTSSRLVVSLRLCLCVFVNTTPLSSPPPVLSFRSLVRSRERASDAPDATTRNPKPTGDARGDSL